MKKKKLLKKVKALEKSFEALINVIQIADTQQTAKIAKIAEFDKSLQGQITRLWAYVHRVKYSSHDDLKKQIGKIWMKLSELN